MNKLFRNRQNSGITLIALVITIIILLILAGISIQALTNTGLLDNASNAKKTTEFKNADEAMKLVITEWKMEKVIGKMTIDEFLESKKPNELDDYEKTINNEYELEKDAYVLVIDVDGNIIEETQKAGLRPKIANIKITLKDGTQIADNSQIVGTKLKIVFDASIEGGQITDVTPSDSLVKGKVSYLTNGTDKKIVFTIKGKIDGQVYTRMLTVSLEDKYIVSEESLIKAVENLNTSSANKLIQVEGENGTVELYNSNVIVYNGNLTFDGTEKSINGINRSISTYSIGDPNNDVGTANAYAKNMVILKVNGDLTVDTGITLTACKSASGYGGPKGLFIYCTGNLTNNGTISMTARGAYAKGQNVYLYKNSNGTYEYVPAVGGAVAVPNSGDAVDGKNGIGRQTGGGGSGSGAWRFTSASGNSIGGNGGRGTSYSGGAGRRRGI